MCEHIFFYLHVLCSSTTGKALTFMTRGDWKWAKELIRILAESDQVCLVSAVDSVLCRAFLAIVRKDLGDPKQPKCIIFSSI